MRREVQAAVTADPLRQIENEARLERAKSFDGGRDLWLERHDAHTRMALDESHAPRRRPARPPDPPPELQSRPALRQLLTCSEDSAIRH